jgi:hypothetical protein
VADHLVGGLHCAEVEDLAASFVLGALEPGEADAVRAHLAGCPEPHPEMAELGSVVPALFEAVEPMEPDPSLKGFIMAAAAADTQRAAEPKRAAEPQRAVEPQRERMPAAGAQRERLPAIDTQRNAGGGVFANLFRRPAWAGVAMAAVIAAVAVGGWGLQVQRENEALVAYRNGVAAVLQQAANPTTQVAVLAGPNGASGPTGIAAVAADGSVRIVMQNLAPTAPEQFYEAWLISGTDAPVPIGGFVVPANGVGTFAVLHDRMGTGVTVALTLESGGDPVTPTLPIIASGAARSSS